MSWGHGLTDADQHHPLQLGGQSVGFPQAYHFLQKRAQTYFYNTTVMMVVFKQNT